MRSGRQAWLSVAAEATDTAPLASALSKVGPPGPVTWLTPPPPPPSPAPAAVTEAPPPPQLDPETLERLCEEGRARGHAEGHAAGLAELADKRKLLGTAVAAAQASITAVHHADAELIVELALGLATGIAGRALIDDTKAAIDLCRSCLAAADPSAGATLWVHPSHVAFVQAELPETPIHADPKLAPGECRAETTRRIVDGSLGARVAALREPLLALVDQARALPPPAPTPPTIDPVDPMEAP